MKHILIFGDSNTWGYDSAIYIPEADAFQRMTEQNDGPPWCGIRLDLITRSRRMR